MVEKAFKLYVKKLNQTCDAAVKAARCTQRTAVLAEESSDQALICKSEVQKYLKKVGRMD